ncbi:hypothetical protein E2C01_044702 [Portunus trituberculatus]|uniref:Uncharacterized protein n=1 Tax=Portunus trituberculatus TaxID=210409 RepID=A0A5B7G146_PORTR|nr:hypothetical protein [Portunus trituberculatus]
MRLPTSSLLSDDNQPRLLPGQACMIFTSLVAALTRLELNDYTVDGNVTITSAPQADRSA